MLLICFVFVVISTSVAYLFCVFGNKYFCCLFVCFWVYMVVVIGTSVAHLFVLCLCGCGNEHTCCFLVVVFFCGCVNEHLRCLFVLVFVGISTSLAYLFLCAYVVVVISTCR